LGVSSPISGASALAGYDIGGDQGYGHQLMDRMQEQGFYLKRFNNGSPAKPLRNLRQPLRRMVVNRRPAHRTPGRDYPK
jgi:hypothetical protein